MQPKLRAITIRAMFAATVVFLSVFNNMRKPLHENLRLKTWKNHIDSLKKEIRVAKMYML